MQNIPSLQLISVRVLRMKKQTIDGNCDQKETPSLGREKETTTIQFEKQAYRCMRRTDYCLHT
jgi:hypothetical protein